MSIPNYTNIDLGPVIITYTFSSGQALPAVGTVLDTTDCHMVVTESNRKDGLLEVLVTPKKSLADMTLVYEEVLKESIDQIAEMIYKATSEGMTSLIGWENLPMSSKTDYMRLTEQILSHLSDNKLLSLQYDSPI